MNKKEELIHSFRNEFEAVAHKFEIMDLLAYGSPMEYTVISNLQLPSQENNIVWHPGVYAFIGNNSLYRVGVSFNSRHRVMHHLTTGTASNGHAIWDINQFEDKAILLFNVKNYNDYHWTRALECFFESRFNPLISAKRR